MGHTILLVDDKIENLTLLKSVLESKGFFVHQASSAKYALSLIRKNPSRYALAIVDYHMPEINGDEATKMFLETEPALQVINITGDDSDETADQCHKAGSFLVLPRLISPARLVSIVQSYCQRFDQKNMTVATYNEKPLTDIENFISKFNMVGASRQTQRACELIEKYASRPETVLIRGENGTGKEKVARAIHDNSLVKNNSFVSVNTSAISPGIIESELFGHIKGAFTGAIGPKKGFFKEADGGTIFLDEIGDLPLSTQVKFLRVLQEKEITPVGSSTPVKINVRVIAATNVDLEKAVKKGTFREDLYYRLNVLPVEVAPLRKRTLDIEPLVQFFLKEWNKKTGENRQMTKNALEMLMKYSWPGNVRQLENTITRMVVIHHDENLDIEHLDKSIFAKKDELKKENESGNVVDIWNQHKIEIIDKEREVLEQIVQLSGSLARASRLMGIAKSTLHARLKNVGAQVNKLWEENV